MTVEKAKDSTALQMSFLETALLLCRESFFKIPFAHLPSLSIFFIDELRKVSPSKKKKSITVFPHTWGIRNFDF